MYKPLFIWGAGIRGEQAHILKAAETANIPIVLTWGAIDLLPHDHPLNMGCFGTHGMRNANLAIQNADVIISFGCRLDTKATGTPKDFAPNAKIYMVDIDAAEIGKMEKLGRPVTGFNMRCNEFTFLDYSEYPIEWLKQCQQWKAENVPTGPAYDLMRRIGEYTTKDDIIVSDTGNTLGWIMQGFPFKGERFMHATNFTPMGYGLGGAIGASFGSNGRRVVCISGDGGMLMSVQELATISRNNLNIKIILMNNGCHSMCVKTEKQWFGGRNAGTTKESGLGFPKDWRLLAESFGIRNVYSFDEWNSDGPSFMEIVIDPDESLAFQVKYGDPLA